MLARINSGVFLIKLCQLYIKNQPISLSRPMNNTGPSPYGHIEELPPSIDIGLGLSGTKESLEKKYKIGGQVAEGGFGAVVVG